MIITLSFSQSEIPERKELLSTGDHKYLVQWKPKLGDVSDEDRKQGFKAIPVTVILTYRSNDQLYRVSQTANVRIKLDPARLRRRIDSKLDLMMGKMPKEIKG